jgi:hypothetical protein
VLKRITPQQGLVKGMEIFFDLPSGRIGRAARNCHKKLAAKTDRLFQRQGSWAADGLD